MQCGVILRFEARLYIGCFGRQGLMHLVKLRLQLHYPWVANAVLCLGLCKRCVQLRLLASQCGKNTVWNDRTY